ncbi:hypothetical protein [Rummeliibacillus pycnus]|uniref:hypothetical protein n=1 Tax=Rummeliibacillus pycnus TaxID=101070 RepID=UPI003D2C539B
MILQQIFKGESEIINSISEKYFSDFKEIVDTRLNIKGMRRFLFGTFLVTCFMVGIPLLNIANSEDWKTIGWSQISDFWKLFFCFELVLASFQILILLFCWKENNFNQKILSILIIIYGYKMSIDPYVFISYAAMDRGGFENIKIYLLFILLLGLLLHFIFLYSWISKLKKGGFSLNGNKDTKKASNSFKFLFPIIFVILTFSVLLIRRIPEFEIVILVIGSIIILIGMAYAVCEFIIAAFCIFRFPSFSVNPPQKKQAFINKKRKKSKR